jgi:hypothetical protein
MPNKEQQQQQQQENKSTEHLPKFECDECCVVNPPRSGSSGADAPCYYISTKITEYTICDSCWTRNHNSSTEDFIPNTISSKDDHRRQQQQEWLDVESASDAEECVRQGYTGPGAWFELDFQPLKEVHKVVRFLNDHHEQFKVVYIRAIEGDQEKIVILCNGLLSNTSLCHLNLQMALSSARTIAAAEKRERVMQAVEDLILKNTTLQAFTLQNWTDKEFAYRMENAAKQNENLKFDLCQGYC